MGWRAHRLARYARRRLGLGFGKLRRLAWRRSTNRLLASSPPYPAPSRANRSRKPLVADGGTEPGCIPPYCSMAVSGSRSRSTVPLFAGQQGLQLCRIKIPLSDDCAFPGSLEYIPCWTTRPETCESWLARDEILLSHLL